MNAALRCVMLFASLASAHSFEAVSIRPSETRGFPSMRGGPGTTDPTRLTFQKYRLVWIIDQAYDLGFFQLKFPHWMNTAEFDIVAKVPSGATKQEMRAMLQQLLAERFKLRVHRETQEMQVLALTIGPNAAKLKESSVPLPVLRDDRVPMLQVNILVTPNGTAWLRGDHGSMSDIARQLTGHLDQPVVDETGLTADYDFTVSWNEKSGPTLTEALEDQLGLKLVAKKARVEVLVVDSAQRIPIEN